MGLLEQAAVSGAAAARRVLDDLRLATPAEEGGGGHSVTSGGNGHGHGPNTSHGNALAGQKGVNSGQKAAHAHRNGAHNGLAVVNLQQ